VGGGGRGGHYLLKRTFQGIELKGKMQETMCCFRNNLFRVEKHNTQQATPQKEDLVTF